MIIDSMITNSNLKIYSKLAKLNISELQGTFNDTGREYQTVLILESKYILDTVRCFVNSDDVEIHYKIAEILISTITYGMMLEDFSSRARLELLKYVRSEVYNISECFELEGLEDSVLFPSDTIDLDLLDTAVINMLDAIGEYCNDIDTNIVFVGWSLRGSRINFIIS